MKHILLTASLLACAPAWGGERSQPGNTQGQGQSQGQGQDQRMRQGQSQRATGGSSSNSVNVTQSGGNGSGGGWSGRTPDPYAPSINGGSNCSVGLSLGGVGSNAGGAIGYTWESEQCSLRQAAAMMASMGDKAQAREALCHIDKLRRSYFSAGTPCAKDWRGWAE